MKLPPYSIRYDAWDVLSQKGSPSFLMKVAEN
jgi:hypothetical protein